MSKLPNHIARAIDVQVNNLMTKHRGRSKQVTATVIDGVMEYHTAFERAMAAHQSKLRMDHLSHLAKGGDPDDDPLNKTKGWNRGNLQHGYTNTRAYRVWAGIVQRCTNPVRMCKPPRKICHQWLSFESFINDVGDMPDEFHQLRLLVEHDTYRPGTAFWRPRDERARGKGVTDPRDWPLPERQAFERAYPREATKAFQPRRRRKE